MQSAFPSPTVGLVHTLVPCPRPHNLGHGTTRAVYVHRVFWSVSVASTARNKSLGIHGHVPNDTEAVRRCWRLARWRPLFNDVACRVNSIHRPAVPMASSAHLFRGERENAAKMAATDPDGKRSAKVGTMLAKLKNYGPLINLIPNTAIQFLDFGFNLNETRVSRAFLTEAGADGRPLLTALYADDASGQFVTQDGRTAQPEQVFSFNAAKPPRCSTASGCRCRSRASASPTPTVTICSTRDRSTGRGRGCWSCRPPTPTAIPIASPWRSIPSYCRPAKAGPISLPVRWTCSPARNSP